MLETPNNCAVSFTFAQYIQSVAANRGGGLFPFLSGLFETEHEFSVYGILQQWTFTWVMRPPPLRGAWTPHNCSLLDLI